MHGMIYSTEPEAPRDFLRDKLELRGADIGGGWRSSIRKRISVCIRLTVSVRRLAPPTSRFIATTSIRPLRRKPRVELAPSRITATVS
jgi:hypothetical protein